MFYLTFLSVSYTFNWAGIYEYKQKFIDGFMMTIVISFFALILSFLIGLFFAYGQSSKVIFLRFFSRFYIEGIRGTPLLVQILIFYYVFANSLGLENRYVVGVVILALFSGAYWAVITMGVTLEIAKLVTVSWLYRNWNLDLLPQSIRAYLLSAVLMLMFITSIGIFGFLSKAHLDTAAPNTGNRLLVKNIERQIDSEKKAITGAQKIVDQLDKALDKVIDKDADKGLIERQKQITERNRANNIITNSSKKITDLSNQKLKYDKDQLAIDKEVGPFKYVAEILFGDADDGNLDRAVRFIIICLILVFDPLAVLMLVAVNVSIKEYQRNKGIINKEQELEKKIERLQKKNDTYKEKQGVLLKSIFGENADQKSLSELNPDEIKVKLDQIMEIKDEKNT